MGVRFRARRRAVNDVVARAAHWASNQPDVPSVVVVGSHAAGRARMGSDLDLVILTARIEEHLRDLAFVHMVAPDGRVVRCEQWGPMHERRVRLESGLIVDFGVSTPAWAALPLDRGTAKVLSDGCRIVVDDGTISGALESIGRPVVEWRPVS